MNDNKKYHYGFLVAILLVVTFFSACKHEIVYPDPEDSNPPDTTTVITDPCDPDSIYFENDILPLIISTCAQPGCHDAATAEDDIILTDYDNIIDHGDIDPFNPEDSELYEVITDPDPDDRMPPPDEGNLTADQINQIYLWISQGALNNGCDECDTIDVTFSEDIFPIIDLNCQGCHSGSSPSGDLELLDYMDISAIAMNGSLYSSVTGNDGYELMPYNGDPLFQCDIDKIEIWINEGAPNN